MQGQPTAGASPMRSARQHRMAALVLALLGLLAVVVGEAENLGAPEEQHDPAQDCMMAVLSPDEDAVYDGQAPPFEITLSTGCDCPPEGRVYHVEIRVSRESNKRHLNASTPFHCKQLQNEGAILDMLDLRDGRWEGYVAIHALSLSIPVRFSYVTESRPQITVLLPPPNYVYGADVDPVIVVHVSDISDPQEQLLGIGVRITVNGRDGGVQKNVGRDKYIKLRDVNDEWFPDGMWDITLQTVDLLERPRGDAAEVRVVIDRTRPTS
ncbi:hypothetical protein T484DRAFT_2022393, partial [Baffinella frigidus]